MLPDQQALIEAINQTMPFGKYAGWKLLQLPEPYLVWFYGKGFPEGKLGQQLALMYEVKLNGLEAMLQPLLKTREDKTDIMSKMPAKNTNLLE